jgi:hypothetical protein
VPDAQVLAENTNSPPLAWPPFELSWSTSRWTPSGRGWSIIGFAAAFSVLLLVESQRSPSSAAAYPVFLAVALAIMLVVVGIVEIVPGTHEKPSGRWTMRVSSEVMSVTQTVKGRSPATATVSRADAGRLVLGFTDDPTSASGMLGRHFGWAMFGAIGALAMQKLAPPRSAPATASAFSVDGNTVIALKHRKVTANLFGYRIAVSPIEVLAAWWPANGRSWRALRDYEQLGAGYWAPPYVARQTTKLAPVSAVWSTGSSGGAPGITDAPTDPLRWS